MKATEQLTIAKAITRMQHTGLLARRIPKPYDRRVMRLSPLHAVRESSTTSNQTSLLFRNFLCDWEPDQQRNLWLTALPRHWPSSDSDV
jgi:hypothetical protein